MVAVFRAEDVLALKRRRRGPAVRGPAGPGRPSTVPASASRWPWSTGRRAASSSRRRCASGRRSRAPTGAHGLRLPDNIGEDRPGVRRLRPRSPDDGVADLPDDCAEPCDCEQRVEQGRSRRLPPPTVARPRPGPGSRPARRITRQGRARHERCRPPEQRPRSACGPRTSGRIAADEALAGRAAALGGRAAAARGDGRAGPRADRAAPPGRRPDRRAVGPGGPGPHGAAGRRTPAPAGRGTRSSRPGCWPRPRAVPPTMPRRSGSGSRNRRRAPLRRVTGRKRERPRPAERRRSPDRVRGEGGRRCSLSGNTRSASTGSRRCAQQVADRLSGSLVSNPALAEELNKQIDDLVAASAQADAAVPRRRPTAGSPSSSASARTRRRSSVTSRSRRASCPTTRTSTPSGSSRSATSTTSTSTSGSACSSVVQKLKQLFEAGAVRLSGGEGAYRLYQFDRRDVLRYTSATASPPTAACSATAAGSARARAGPTPTSTCCSATSSTR